MSEYNDNHRKRVRSRRARLQRVHRRFRTRLAQYRRLVVLSTAVAAVLAGILGFVSFNASRPEPVLLGRGAAGVMTRADSVRMADSLQALDAARMAGVEPGRTLGSGEASYYGGELAGQPTASGERFNPAGLTAAHRTLPLGSQVRVTNLRNGQSVVVRINDRGPFSGRRVIDVSQAAARRLGMLGRGTAMVRLELMTGK